MGAEGLCWSSPLVPRWQCWPKLLTQGLAPWQTWWMVTLCASRVRMSSAARVGPDVARCAVRRGDTPTHPRSCATPTPATTLWRVGAQEQRKFTPDTRVAHYAITLTPQDTDHDAVYV